MKFAKWVDIRHLFFNFYFYFILLYNTVLVLPYIDMNPERERRKEGRKGRKRKLCKVMGILTNLIVNISQYHKPSHKPLIYIILFVKYTSIKLKKVNV